MLASVFVLLWLSASFPPHAQNPSISSKNTNRQQKLTAIRRTALSALEPLVEDLRQVDDIGERVALAQPLVSLLSKSRPEACRKLLNQLFDDSFRLKNEPPDKENDPDPDLLARKIIQIAATFDRKLSKSLLEKYDTQNTFDKTNASASREASRTKFYLTLATDLIQRDVVLAASIAEKAIPGPVTPETLTFLILLRQKDASTANRLCSNALAGVRSRGGMDPNESLLLFSYIFSPNQVPIITPQGLSVYHLANFDSLPTNPPNIVLAEEYLDTTVQLLLEPARYSRRDSFPAFGPTGDWFLIRLIESKVIVYRPNLVDPLIAQRYVVEGQMENRRSDAAASLDKWNSPSGSTSNSANKNDTVESLLKRAEQAPNTQRRDQFLYRAATAAVRLEEYDRAVKIADELSIEYRGAAKGFLNFGMALAAVHKDDVERASRLAEKDDDLLRRVYVFTLIAKSLVERKNPDIEQARLYLSSFEQLIPRLASDRERVSALTGAVQVYAVFDQTEAFKALQELVRYANKVESFAGEVSVERILEIGGFYFDYSLYTDSTIDEALKTLALLDFNEALGEVHQFENRAARIRATVAVCKSVLS